MGGEAKRRRELAGRFGVKMVSYDGHPTDQWCWSANGLGESLRLETDDEAEAERIRDEYARDNQKGDYRVVPLLDPEENRPGMRFVGIDGVSLQGGSAGRRGTRAALQASWRTYPLPPPRMLRMRHAKAAVAPIVNGKEREKLANRARRAARVPVVVPVQKDGRIERVETVTTPGTAIDLQRRNARAGQPPHADLLIQLRQHPLAYATDEAHKGLIIRLRRRVMQKRAILGSGRRLRVHGVRRPVPPMLRAFRAVRLSELSRRLRKVMRKAPAASEAAAPTTEAA